MIEMKIKKKYVKIAMNVKKCDFFMRSHGINRHMLWNKSESLTLNANQNQDIDTLTKKNKFKPLSNLL